MRNLPPILLYSTVWGRTAIGTFAISGLTSFVMTYPLSPTSTIKARPAVLLLHGLCSSTQEVRIFARTLREHGFHVSAPTLSGYSAAVNLADTVDEGDNPLPNYRRWIADACAELDKLANSHDEVSICGVSLGATLALAVAAERSAHICSLSLISTTLFFDGWNVSRWRFLLPLAYYTPLGHWYRYRETPPYGVQNERVRAWIASQLARGSRSSAGASTIPTKSLREANRLIRHVKRMLGRVHTPALMIHAQEDDVASLANVDFVRGRIGSDMFRELVVCDSYHIITLDNDCALAALKTAQFFNSVAQWRTEASRAVSSWAVPPARRRKSDERGQSA
jgi:carboxylesterase